MKHTVIACSILLALFGFSLWSATTVQTRVTETELLLQEAMEQQLQENRDAAQMAIRRASDHWEKHEALFEILLRHDDVDCVMEEFARLCAYASTVDEDDFVSNCSALLATLRHIREMEWPLLHNIL